MNSLYLNINTWDLEIDSFGNIAVASDPYALAQNAATAIRTFAGDCYYNQLLGIPYFQNILGQLPPIEYVRSQNVKAALAVPGITAAKCFISSATDRVIHGQIQVTDKNNFTIAAGF